MPANRLGFTVMTLGQLKILQEVITLSVFVPFAVLYMHQPLKLDFLWGHLFDGRGLLYVQNVKFNTKFLIHQSLISEPTRTLVKHKTHHPR